MAIDPSREDIFPISGLRERTGLQRHRQSLKRWYRRGIMSPVTGDRVKLEVIYQGNLTCTSLEAYYRFMFRFNGQPIPDHLASTLPEEDEFVGKPVKSAKKPMPSKPAPPQEKKAARGKKC